jgi:hypothetical protein
LLASTLHRLRGVLRRTSPFSRAGPTGFLQQRAHPASQLAALSKPSDRIPRKRFREFPLRPASARKTPRTAFAIRNLVPSFQRTKSRIASHRHAFLRLSTITPADGVIRHRASPVTHPSSFVPLFAESLNILLNSLNHFSEIENQCALKLAIELSISAEETPPGNNSPLGPPLALFSDSSFILHPFRQPSPIPHPPFAISHLPSVICHLSLAICHPSSSPLIFRVFP